MQVSQPIKLEQLKRITWSSVGSWSAVDTSSTLVTLVTNNTLVGWVSSKTLQTKEIYFPA